MSFHPRNPIALFALRLFLQPYAFNVDDAIIIMDE